MNKKTLDKKKKNKIDYKTEQKTEHNSEFKKDKKITVQIDNKFEKKTGTSNKFEKNTDHKFENKMIRKFEKEEKKRTENKASNRTSSKTDNGTSNGTKYKTDRKPFDRASGEVENVERKSLPKSKCPIFYKCPGCQYIDLPYEEQLEIKQKRLRILLDSFCKVDPIIGMENPFYYKNKVHSVFHRKKDGTIISGVYDEKTRNIVPVGKCFIENKKAGEIINSIAELIKSFKFKVYNEKSGFGFMRDAIIRTGFQSGQIMVILVTTGLEFPSKSNFVKALMKKHPEITTIIQSVNTKDTTTILGDREEVLYGKGFIEDTQCGNIFRISAKSYYEINPVQSEKLYQKAIQLADLKKKETIIDTYCGIGTLGIIASKLAKEVMGVDLNKDAIKDARINAKKNDVKNINFYNNDAAKFMLDLVEHEKQVDVIFLDPPRIGCEEELLSSVLELAPKKIIYISRGPEVLERDLKILKKKKTYEVTKICPVDLFPMTSHVESIILMTYCGLEKK
ncbi:MAG TPA: 23S rRNA (uracil(1939)-C(5))-methyltransferase RlmD [Lachnospiraceae bacterium]|nr:23S rRNA (uracil(1939)-C(5))-methyltransferase RlmD [Lachnospiraceae bacterium]